MSKFKLIVHREYATRVRKKSFLLMTILGPLLTAGLIFAKVWLDTAPKEVQKIQVIDDSGIFTGKLESSNYLEFYYSNKKISAAKKEFYNTDFNVLLFIPENILTSNKLQLFYKKQIGLSSEEVIKGIFNKKIEGWKLIASGIDKDKLASAKTSVLMATSKLEESGEQKSSNSGINAAIGFTGAALIYIFIFLYGAQVMRGVIEEKSNRIVEVIISSVRPFELMMGKIVGIALVGLTQFLLWIGLTFTIVSVAGNLNKQSKYDASAIKEQTFKSNVPINEAKDLNYNQDELDAVLGSVNFTLLIAAFLFYFLGGYLLYGALFAAIGAAVDSEADTQQFMLPITIPLLLAFMMAESVVSNPESNMAFWFSIVPFTSPVIMMVRIAYGVPPIELFLSMLLLVIGFIATTWISAKIYRTGILLYGKKTSYKELWKWLFYKV